MELRTEKKLKFNRENRNTILDTIQDAVDLPPYDELAF
jgi:hypothetical protein